MRPIFFGASINPAVMDVLFAPETRAGAYRIVRGVKIRAAVCTLEEASAAGMREVRAFTTEQADLLREVSVEVSREELTRDDERPAFAIETLLQSPVHTGPVYCPACCRKLGAGDSPALGYLRACPGCKRSLSIESHENGFTIVLGPPPA